MDAYIALAGMVVGAYLMAWWDRHAECRAHAQRELADRLLAQRAIESPRPLPTGHVRVVRTAPYDWQAQQ